MKRIALFMVLSSKVRDKELILLDKLKVKEPKTKGAAIILKKILKPIIHEQTQLLRKKQKNILIVIPKKDENMIRASKNIPYVKTIQANSLNILDLLSFKYLAMPKETVNVIKDTYLKSKDKNKKEKV